MSAWFQRHRQQIFKVLGSLIAFGSLFFLLKSQSWDAILDAVQQVSWQRFVLALGLLFLSRFFTVGRWYVLLRSGGVDISFGQATSITFTGLFASNFLPSTVGGDLVRIGGVLQFGDDRVVSTASVLVDRLVGMAGMVMVLPVGIFSFSQWYTRQSTFLSVTFPALVEKVRQGFAKFLTAFQIWLKKPLSLVGSLLFTWGHMLCLFGALKVLSGGLHENISYWTLAGIWSLAYFVTLIPISVNGYGLQELSLTYLLSNVGGMTLTHSLVIALLSRIVFVVASLPGAFFLSSIMATIRSDKELYEEGV